VAGILKRIKRPAFFPTSDEASGPHDTDARF
jgi:hypothetical protein